jgi:peptide-methionine (S)-S-oxide reductase
MGMRLAIVLLAVALPLSACRAPTSTAAPDSKTSVVAVGTDPGGVGRGTPLQARPGHELAAFAAGCFWGVEDAFRHVRGVRATAVGYTGGHTEDPTYDAVCTHTTGHAEAVLVEFDPKIISFEKLTAIFFKIHDPTQVDQQGPDVGDQYRSEIFTLNDAQARSAASVRDQLQAEAKTKFATKIEPLSKFWRAEGYHQQYAERTGSHGCPISLPPEAT